MDFWNRFARKFLHASLGRNRRFMDLHKGQACYIFGNGASLKSMDLGKFSDQISIGCNSLFLHKDFNKLDCRYYQIPASLFFYPYCRYYGKIERNHLGKLYRRKIRQNPRPCYFTSLSNYFGIRSRNIFYTHHFGVRSWDPEMCDMAGVFSFMQGATYAMLGTAIYMGFESAVLIGVDYASSPVISSHFYENGRGEVQRGMNSSVYGSLFEVLNQRIQITAIVPSGVTSDVVKYIEYEKYVGTPSAYVENNHIVAAEDLDALKKLGYHNIY